MQTTQADTDQTTTTLEQTFLSLVQTYGTSPTTAQTLWAVIYDHYTEPHRHYHTLTHLDNLLKILRPMASQTHNWHAVLFALYYHDIIYNPAQHNNEQLSAALAVQTLQSIGVHAETIALCEAHILATQHHHPAPHPDSDLFTDADLAILGCEWTDYIVYISHIRQEYDMFTDHDFRAGRLAFTQKLLQQPQIFKTIPFLTRYESAARRYLQRDKQDEHGIIFSP